MSVHPSDIDAYIKEKLASGQFHTREEFFLEAARVYRRLESRREQLQKEIEVGIRASEEGRVEPFDLADLKREVLSSMDEFGQPRSI
jgi:hypothetical protein